MGAESTMPPAAQGWANQKAKEEILAFNATPETAR